MEKLNLFSNKNLKITIRTIVIDEKPYFVGSDIAKALDYKKPQNAINQHCRYALKRGISDNQGVPHEYNVIPEGDVYRLILRSKLPEAEKFEDWIVNEILPSIRKHGMFATDRLLNNPELFKKTVDKYYEEHMRRLRVERQLELNSEVIKEQAPKVKYHDEVITSISAFNTTTIAKELGMSAQKLNKILHKKRWSF